MNSLCNLSSEELDVFHDLLLKLLLALTNDDENNG